MEAETTIEMTMRYAHLSVKGARALWKPRPTDRG